MEFKFQIGDFVLAHQGVQDSLLRSRAGAFHLPKIFMVVERQTNECHGGTQRYYLCAADGQALRFSEIELMPADDLDLKALIDAYEASKKLDQKE